MNARISDRTGMDFNVVWEGGGRFWAELHLPAPQFTDNLQSYEDKVVAIIELAKEKGLL